MEERHPGRRESGPTKDRHELSRAIRTAAAAGRRRPEPQRILEAATEVFARRGLDATLDDIARTPASGWAPSTGGSPARRSWSRPFEKAVDEMVELAVEAANGRLVGRPGLVHGEGEPAPGRGPRAAGRDHARYVRSRADRVSKDLNRTKKIATTICSESA